MDDWNVLVLFLLNVAAESWWEPWTRVVPFVEVLDRFGVWIRKPKPFSDIVYYATTQLEQFNCFILSFRWSLGLILASWFVWNVSFARKKRKISEGCQIKRKLFSTCNHNAHDLNRSDNPFTNLTQKTKARKNAIIFKPLSCQIHDWWNHFLLRLIPFKLRDVIAQRRHVFILDFQSSSSSFWAVIIRIDPTWRDMEIWRR